MSLMGIKNKLLAKQVSDVKEQWCKEFKNSVTTTSS
jgi:hypothetical protein